MAGKEPAPTQTQPTAPPAAGTHGRHRRVRGERNATSECSGALVCFQGEGEAKMRARTRSNSETSAESPRQPAVQASAGPARPLHAGRPAGQSPRPATSAEPAWCSCRVGRAVASVTASRGRPTPTGRRHVPETPSTALTGKEVGPAAHRAAGRNSVTCTPSPTAALERPPGWGRAGACGGPPGRRGGGGVGTVPSPCPHAARDGPEHQRLSGSAPGGGTRSAGSPASAFLPAGHSQSSARETRRDRDTMLLGRLPAGSTCEGRLWPTRPYVAHPPRQ